MEKPYKDSTIFFHNGNDYTGSTRVLANIIINDYADVEQVPIILSRRTDSGCLSNIDNVKLLFFPRVKTNLLGIGTAINILIKFLYCLFLATKYKAFYINTILPYFALLTGVLTRRKVICHVHEYFVIKDTRVKICEWCVCHLPISVIFVSKYLESKYTLNKRSISEVRYNKLSKDFISAVNLKPIESRSRDSILLLSWLSEHKGLYNYVKLAWAMPQYNFTMVISNTQDRIDAFFKDVSIPENCIIHSATNNVHQYLHNTDLIMNLSIPELWTETFGMTILEAMPYGIPAIVPNAGGPLELIEDGINGYAVDVTDIELIKERVKYIMDANNYKRFSEAALNVYNLKFA